MSECYNAKVVLLGESACGKSSIARRFMSNDFNEYSESTIGATFCVKRMDNYSIKFEIWDTAGQERYHSLAPMYYRGAAAAIVVYDITNKSTLDRAMKWISELEKCSNNNVYIILVGNKSDLHLSRKVYPEDIQNLIGERYCHLETSAKLNNNIYEIFDTIARNLKKPNIDCMRTINLNDKPVKKRKCC